MKPRVTKTAYLAAQGMAFTFYLAFVAALIFCLIGFFRNLYHDDFSPPPEPGAGTSTVLAPAQYIIMDVSGYDAGACCCGKWADGFTASGVPAVGRICAAPPEYAFGTRLFVEGMGEYVVQDRGGAIKGNKLDLLFPTHAEALEFGRKNLKVRILK